MEREYAESNQNEYVFLLYSAVETRLFITSVSLLRELSVFIAALLVSMYGYIWMVEINPFNVRDHLTQVLFSFPDKLTRKKSDFSIHSWYKCY